jgi:hypothetical protein
MQVMCKNFINLSIACTLNMCDNNEMAMDVFPLEPNLAVVDYINLKPEDWALKAI